MPEKDEPLKEVASISDVARMLSLSRGRFYELMKEGIFPRPSRNEETGRPFYSREQQEDCIRVRRTNCGINGRAILFYCRRLDGRRDEIARGRDRRDHSPRPSPQNALLQELRGGLARLGMASASDSSILTAVGDCFPDGIAETDMPSILTAVLRHLTRQDSQDNVTR